MRKQKERLRDIDLYVEGIEGVWNVPLLNNTAELFNTTCTYLDKYNIKEKPALLPSEKFKICPSLLDLKERYDQVIACETGSKSKNIFHYKFHSLKTALIVGNELEGIDNDTLNICDDIISIPVIGKGMQSFNVGVAACLSLYCLFQNFHDRKQLSRKLIPDVLLVDPEDPHELGSVLRTLWCFGWDSVYLKDSNKLWYGGERDMRNLVLEASRGAKNRTTIKPFKRCSKSLFDRAFVMAEDRGVPLSRLNLASAGRSIFILPDTFAPLPNEKVESLAKTHETFYVDFPNKEIPALYRLKASVILMYIMRHFI